MAASKGFSDICQLLLDHGASVNAISVSGISALMLAAEAKSISTVRLLLNRGSSIEKRDKNGNSVLHYALPCSNRLLHLLLNNGADVNVMNTSRWTPLMIAGSASNCGNALLLADAGAFFYRTGNSIWSYFTIQVKRHLLSHGYSYS